MGKLIETDGYDAASRKLKRYIDEGTTTVKVAASGVNVNGTAKKGNIVLGMAAKSQVDTAISSGTASANLPTSAAVAAFLESKGYQTTDNKVLNTKNNSAKAYLTGTTTASTNTGSQIFDTGVYLTTNPGELAAATFKGNLAGNVTGNAATASSAAQLTNARKINNTVFNGTADITTVKWGVSRTLCFSGASTGS